MTMIIRTALCSAMLLTPSFLGPQAKETLIEKDISKLRSLSDTKRPIETIRIAAEIQALPAGESKLKDADSLSHLVTEGDQGHDALQAVADALAKALAETPTPIKGDAPPMPYIDLAKLVRYEHVSVALDDPLYTKALQALAASEADIAKADFTLKDLHNKPVTLSELRGKVVWVNFWATWCPPCRAEMPAMDAFYAQYKSQGLVILSISDEDPAVVSKFLSQYGYQMPVLLDPGDSVHKQFHIQGIPQSFFFNREGKLVALSIDECTPRQFAVMLAQSGLQ